MSRPSEVSPQSTHYVYTFLADHDDDVDPRASPVTPMTTVTATTAAADDTDRDYPSVSPYSPAADDDSDCERGMPHSARSSRTSRASSAVSTPALFLRSLDRSHRIDIKPAATEDDTDSDQVTPDSVDCLIDKSIDLKATTDLDDLATATDSDEHTKGCCKRVQWRRVLVRLAIAIVSLTLVLTAVAIVSRANARAHFRVLSDTIAHASYVQCSSPDSHEACEQADPQLLDEQNTYMMVASSSQEEHCDIHPSEALFLGTVFVSLAHKDMTLMDDILNGAHVVVRYDPKFPQYFGWYYRFFTTMQDAYTRTSSHRSSSPQYGIPEGAVLKTLLVGEQPDSPTLDSWFQLEGAQWNPLHAPLSSVMHILNYLQYKLTNRQVGPLGTSEHTDSNPVFVDFRPANTPSS